ncbi:predicted protein [Postia placenta Mad-698-R]|nr:predicted protein [Postia placenta Mad-698-R]
MVRRCIRRSSLVRVNVSTIANNTAAPREAFNTSPDEQRSQSDIPYMFGNGKEAPNKPPAALSECKTAREDAKHGRTASGVSSREPQQLEDRQPLSALVTTTSDIKASNWVTKTSPHGILQANEGLAPTQQTKKEVKFVADGAVCEDRKTDDPWSLCADEVWKFEERQVNKWKENINNLLLFAGLFSTILAAFLAAFYMLLGPQTPDTTTQVLVVMAAQLSLLTAAITNHNLTDSQQAILDAAIVTTHPTTTTVSTGVLWFIALIFSLGAASISIAVDRASSLSRQSVRIWYLRRRGIQKWHVQAIIDILPILLQISLALFLVGLLNLVWHLDYIVAGISTIIIASLLLPTLLAVLMPYCYADCPYKSRSAWWCFVTLNRLAHSRITALVVKCGRTLWTGMTNVPTAAKSMTLGLRSLSAATRNWLSGLREIFTLNRLVQIRLATEISRLANFVWQNIREFPINAIRITTIWCQIVGAGVTSIWGRLSKACHEFTNWMRSRSHRPQTWGKWHSDTLGARNWREFENVIVRVDDTPEDMKLIMLAEADEMIMDDAFLVDVVHPFFQNGSLKSTVPALLRILRHRAHKVVVEKDQRDNNVTTLKWLRSEQDSAAIIAMADLCIDVLQKYDKPCHLNSDHLLDHLLQLIRAMPLIDPARVVCNRAGDLIQRAAALQQYLREARIDELDDGADECFLEYVVPAWLRVVDMEESLEPFYNILQKRFNGPASVRTTHILSHRALDVLECISLESHKASAEHQILIFDIVLKALDAGLDATSVYTRLVHLLPTPVLCREALDNIVSILCRFHMDFRLDLDDTRTLLAFLSHARKRLGTEQFIRITYLALRNSAFLSPEDFDRVHSNVRGALEVFVEYFSSSRVEKVVGTDAWLEFSQLLRECLAVAHVDVTRPARGRTLFGRDVINALERSMPLNPSLKRLSAPQKDDVEAPEEDPREINSALMQ